MSAMSLIIFAVGTTLVAASAVLLATRISKSCAKRPPGPGLISLLIGQDRVTSKYQEKTFWKWKKYGDVIYFKLFRTPVIVLNTLESARDLLDKRSAKYSDRPRMVLLAELGGHDSSIPAMRYGERFRKHRRWIHEAVGTKAALERVRPIQLREVRTLVRNLVETPEAFSKHIFGYVVAIILEVTYGRRLESLDDELVQLAERSTIATNAGGNPGSMLVDFVPILRHMPTWMPGTGFKRRALRARKYLEIWRKRGVEMVLEDMASGTGSPCVVRSLLEAHQGDMSTAELEDISALAVSIYGDGTESTIGTLLLFMLAITRNPQVLRKAQDEMDAIVGPDRLPDFNDRASLPYLSALLEEVLRWNPSLPLSVPHRLILDDEYDGHRIPAGSMVIPNVWGMTRDERYYPRPEEFVPERHLRLDDHDVSNNPAPSRFVFGFGRRICPGQGFADATLWLAMANIIAAFDVLKPLDANGNEVTPPAAFKPGFTSRPEPFGCRRCPRSEKTMSSSQHEMLQHEAFQDSFVL